MTKHSEVIDQISQVCTATMRYVQDEKQWYVCGEDNVWRPEDVMQAWTGAEQALRDSLGPDYYYSYSDLVGVMGLLKGRCAARSTLFDADPRVLSTPSCIVHLGELHPGKIYSETKSSDLVTHCTAVDLDYTSVVDVEDMILRLCGGDRELASFIRRCAGYTLIGSQSEEVMFALYGPTRTGKSTLIDGMLGALGTYGTTIRPQALMRGDDPMSRYSMARLKGVRMVATTEPPPGAVFDSTTVKQMTSDLIEARHPGLKSFVFRPQYTLWMACNDVPRINGDSAMLRRLIVIPLRHQFAPDDGLKEWVRGPARGGFLAWMNTGCWEYLERGLNPPETVKRTIEDYANMEDDIGQFVLDEIVMSPTSSVYSSALYARYGSWCEREGSRPLSMASLKHRLLSKGITQKRTSQGNTYVGVTLRQRSALQSVQSIM